MAKSHVLSGLIRKRSVLSVGIDLVIRSNLRQRSRMDPDHSAIMTEYGLKPGDRPGTDLYLKI